MRRIMLTVAVVLGLGACTPREVRAWLAWHRQDPVAAERFARDLDRGGGDRPSLGGACGQWSDDALAAGWSASQWPTLDRIMYRESRCQPGAYNPSGASGLLQIMPMWADDCGGSSSDLFDPGFNLRCGRYVYRVQGWSAWSTY